MLEKDELRKAINDYVENYSVEANFSPRTIQNKRGSYNRFLQWVNKPYTLQTVREYFLFLNHKGLQPSSLMDETRMFRALTNFLFKRGYITENFASDIVKPKVPKKDYPDISQEVVDKIIEAGVEVGSGDRKRSKFYKEEARLALHFILRTGLRISETLQLKGSDFSLYGDPPSFKVHSKGGDIDTMPLPRDVIDTLSKRLENPKVFATSEKLCNLILDRGVKKLGLTLNSKLTCHSLRHIFATTQVRNKVTPQYLASLMRHSSIEITNKYYTHLNLVDLSLVINSQPIVREGLKENEIFDMVTAAIKSTGVDNDKRYILTMKKKENAFQVTVKLK